MPGDRTAAVIRLAELITKAACRLWLGPIAATGEDIADMLATSAESELQKRRAEQVFDKCIDTVATRILRRDAYFGNIAPYEREAAIGAANDTLTLATSAHAAQFDLATSLSPDKIIATLAPARERVLASALLSDRALLLYDRILNDSARYIAEIVKTLPGFTEHALAELLPRQTQIIASLDAVLQRDAMFGTATDFPSAYERVVAAELDRMELFGVSLRERVTRVYLLGPSYVEPFLSGPGELEQAASASSVLARHGRVLIRGEAGSGKTTLLRAIAVRSARKLHADDLLAWNGSTPFYLPLRAYRNGQLPGPEHFPSESASVIAGEMPDQWVHKTLREGKALILVDGIDEMAAGPPRERAHEWLRQLIGEFPSNRFVVTSRPAAIERGAFSDLGFQEYSVEPMDDIAIRWLIERWHETLAAGFAEDERAVEEVRGDERSLIAAIDSDVRLRLMARNPLLCALLCALNRDRRRHLPRALMAIYRAALDMFLERRDVERELEAEIALTGEQTEFLLSDLACYLVSNGWSDVSLDRAAKRLGQAVKYLPNVKYEPDSIMRILLERSGMLRSPSEDSIDFVHRTFQEYLAAERFIDDDDIGVLISHARDDQWRNVLVMAVGHATASQASELLSELLKLGRAENDDDVLTLAVSCLQTVGRLSPSVQSDLSAAAIALLPPKDFQVAEALSHTGPSLLPALAERETESAEEAMRMVRTASLIGGAQALEFISRLATRRIGMSLELGRASVFFDAKEYVSSVLSRAQELSTLLTTDLRLLPFLNQISSIEAIELEGIGDAASLRSARPGPRVRSLRLSKCAVSTVSWLECWARLEILDLDMIGRLPDLTGIDSAPNIARLSLSFGEGRVMRLDPLRKLRWLRRLSISRLDRVAVDLSPLGVQPDLIVTVPQDAKVENPHGIEIRRA